MNDFCKIYTFEAVYNVYSNFATNYASLYQKQQQNFIHFMYKMCGWLKCIFCQIFIIFLIIILNF